MRRMLFVVVFLSEAMGAAPPLSGPVMLTAEEQKALNAIAVRLEQAAKKGRFEDAERLAREIVSLRAKWQGERYWETADARLAAEGWQRRTRVPMKDREKVIRALRANQEGSRLFNRGKYKEGSEKMSEGLALRREVLGEAHPDTATSYSDLAYCLNKQGQPATALPLFEKALAIWQKTLGEAHPHTALGYTGVASCLRARGQPARALPLFEKALAIYQKALVEIHPDTAESYSHLASCLQELGKSARALPLFENALAIRRKALGEEHTDTAQSYNAIATSLQNLGQPARALPYFEKALAICLKTLGETHPITAYCYNNVAACVQALGQPARALPFFEKALAIWRKVLGESHPRTAISYNNVAYCLQALGQPARALPLYEKALAIWQKALGEAHLDTAFGYNNVAYCLQALGQPSRAMPLFEKALAIWQKVLGEAHPHTANGHSNIAYCLQALGQPARALPLYEKALAIHLKAQGEAHPDTAVGYDNVAFCLEALGQPARALPFHEKALAIHLKAFGKAHPDTAAGYNNVAYCLKALGDPARALPLFENALAINKKVHGEAHPETAGSYNNVAYCRNDLAQPARALPLYEKALAIRLKALGEVHLDTADSYHNVAFCLQAMGRGREAVLLTQASLSGREAARFNQASSGFDRAASTRLVSPHALLALQLSRLGQPHNAFRHAEASLARGLLDDLARTDPDDIRRFKDLEGRIAALDKQLLPLFGTIKLTPENETQRDRFARRRRVLMDEQSRLGAAMSQRQLVLLEPIQACLPADAVLVLWIEIKGAAPVACVVRRTGPPVWVPIPGGGKRWEDADHFLPTQAYLATIAQSLSLKEREEFIDREPEKFRGFAKAAFEPSQRAELAASLRKQRIEPLLGHLNGARHLFVVPTGRLAPFPVELLAPEFSVSIIPSGSFLHRILKSHRPLDASSMLALGDPVFTPPGVKSPQPPETGLFIAAVVPGSAAATAGLQAGDVLVKHGDERLYKIDDLQKAGAGTLTLWRNGNELTRRIPAGSLGISIDRNPPREAIALRRKLNDSLVLRGTGHAPLPGSAYEVNALAALVKNTTKLLGSAASEQALDALNDSKKLRTFRILHFATHGELRDQLPDLSHLVLAQDTLPNPHSRPIGAKVYDGRLTVKTIRRDWELDADLVVLSACQTALGREAGGDGLLGFAHAFLARGARCVVLSRWKVDDGATSLLMVRFYENLLGKRGKKLGRAAALQEAKDWLRTLPRAKAELRLAHLTKGTLRGSEGELPPLAKEDKRPALPKGDRPYEHPFYWAAWALVGDPD